MIYKQEECKVDPGSDGAVVESLRAMSEVIKCTSSVIVWVRYGALSERPGIQIVEVHQFFCSQPDMYSYTSSMTAPPGPSLIILGISPLYKARYPSSRYTSAML